MRASLGFAMRRAFDALLSPSRSALAVARQRNKFFHEDLARAVRTPHVSRDALLHRLEQPPLIGWDLLAVRGRERTVA